jgi:hypothetical protein
MAIGTAAAILGGASIAAGLIGSNKQANAAKDAASMQAEAANSDRELQKYMYDTTRADQAPWLQAGGGAVTSLGSLLGTSGSSSAAGYGSLAKPFGASDFQADPGYQFNLAEGQKALDRTASAKGSYFSGAAAKALNRYSQDYASGEFQNAYNRYNTNQTNLYNKLSNLAGLGQTAANSVGNANQNYANNTGQANMNAATAQGNGLIGAASAWNSGLGNTATSLGALFNSGNKSYATAGDALYGMF